MPKEPPEGFKRLIQAEQRVQLKIESGLRLSEQHLSFLVTFALSGWMLYKQSEFKVAHLDYQPKLENLFYSLLTNLLLIKQTPSGVAVGNDGFYVERQFYDTFRLTKNNLTNLSLWFFDLIGQGRISSLQEIASSKVWKRVWSLFEIISAEKGVVDRVFEFLSQVKFSDVYQHTADTRRQLSSSLKQALQGLDQTQKVLRQSQQHEYLKSLEKERGMAITDREAFSLLRVFLFLVHSKVNLNGFSVSQLERFCKYLFTALTLAQSPLVKRYSKEDEIDFDPTSLATDAQVLGKLASLLATYDSTEFNRQINQGESPNHGWNDVWWFLNQVNSNFGLLKVRKKVLRLIKANQKKLMPHGSQQEDVGQESSMRLSDQTYSQEVVAGTSGLELVLWSHLRKLGGEVKKHTMQLPLTMNGEESREIQLFGVVAENSRQTTTSPRLGGVCLSKKLVLDHLRYPTIYGRALLKLAMYISTGQALLYYKGGVKINSRWYSVFTTRIYEEYRAYFLRFTHNGFLITLLIGVINKNSQRRFHHNLGIGGGDK